MSYMVCRICEARALSSLLVVVEDAKTREKSSNIEEYLNNDVLIRYTSEFLNGNNVNDVFSGISSTRQYFEGCPFMK